MDIKKLVQIVGYVLSKYGGKMNYTKLIKLLYLADRKAMEISGYPITGDSYVSMQNGVVLSGLYDLIKDKYPDNNIQRIWDSRFSTDGFDIILMCPSIPHGLLSDVELETLDAIDSEFHDYSFGQMIEYIHNPNNCPEWKETTSSIPLSIDDVYLTLGYSKDEIESLREEERFYAEEDEMINTLDEVRES